MKLRVGAAVVVLFACTAACAEDADDARPAPPPPAAAASPSASSNGFASLQEAREEYLRLLQPSGESVEALSELLDDPEAPVGDVQQAVADYGRATEQFASALQAREWPEAVEAPIAELSGQLLAQVEPTRAAARGGSVDEIAALLRKVPGASAAERVRAAFQDPGNGAGEDG